MTAALVLTMALVAAQVAIAAWLWRTFARNQGL